MPDATRDYFHHLHNTLILLGAGERFASLLDHPETITMNDVDDLRRYNCRLIDSVKDKLVGIHKLAIQVQPPSEDDEDAL